MRSVVPLLLSVSLSLACGGPRPDAMRAAATAKSMKDADIGDPICGAGWRWSGQRCVHAEEAAQPIATTEAPPRAKGGAELAIEDVRVGTGAEAKSGDKVSVHYTGSLPNGTVFDSSKPRGTPFDFRLGEGQVIKGFDRAVTGMKVGGVRKVTIPPELGYGRKGAPPAIPPNATLIFELELLDVKP